MPEATLKALADHGEIGPIMAPTAGDARPFWRSSLRPESTWKPGGQLQDEGAKSFVKSWNELMAVIASKSAALQQAA